MLPVCISRRLARDLSTQLVVTKNQALVSVIRRSFKTAFKDFSFQLLVSQIRSSEGFFYPFSSFMIDCPIHLFSAKGKEVSCVWLWLDQKSILAVVTTSMNGWLACPPANDWEAIYLVFSARLLFLMSISYPKLKFRVIIIPIIYSLLNSCVSYTPDPLFYFTLIKTLLVGTTALIL